MKREDLTGVGLGLRWSFLDDVMAALDAHDTRGAEALAPARFFEVSPENYMRRGGYIPAALERVRADVPILTHGLTLSIGGDDPFDAAYLRELRAFIGRLDVPFHSDHLCASTSGGRVFHDLLPVPFSSASAKHAALRIAEARDALALPLAVENITYYLAPSIEPRFGADLVEAEASFLAEVLDRSGAGLLLDVNNVVVNAKNHGLDPLAFLGKIPLDRVVQIHVAGHTSSADDGLFIDTHGAPVEEPVHELLAWVIERTGPLPVILERDHAIPTLPALLAELGHVARAYDRGLALHEARQVHEADRAGEVGARCPT